MNILAIDTTSKKASVSILKENNDNSNIFTNTVDNDITHSEKLMPLIDNTLRESQLNLNDIDLLACILGPGSFTGIRIGLSSIKALAKVLEKKIFGISTLEIMAYANIDESKTNQYILSVMDAKNNRVYYSLYKVNYINNVPFLENILIATNSIIEDCEKAINDYFKTSQGLNIGIVVNSPHIALDILNSSSLAVTEANTDIVLSMIKRQNNIKDGLDKYIFDYLTLDAVYARKSVAEREKYGE